MEEPVIETQTKIDVSDKPKVGTWANIQPFQKKPSIKWVLLNEEHTVTFTRDEPYEYQREDGSVFYIFDVMEDGVAKSILTSAWSLLRGLKEHTPLLEKTFVIKKVANQGRYTYSVTLQQPAASQ